MTARNGGARILAESGPTLSVKEAAVVLGVSSDLVRSMVRRGELAALGVRVLKLGSRIRIGTESLRRAVEADSRQEPRTGAGI